MASDIFYELERRYPIAADKYTNIYGLNDGTVSAILRDETTESEISRKKSIVTKEVEINNNQITKKSIHSLNNNNKQSSDIEEETEKIYNNISNNTQNNNNNQNNNINQKLIDANILNKQLENEFDYIKNKNVELENELDFVKSKNDELQILIEDLKREKTVYFFNN